MSKEALTMDVLKSIKLTTSSRSKI